MSLNELKDLKKILRIFAETYRMRILSLLARESLTVAEMCQVLGSSQSNISKHLTKLRLVNFVSDKREGQFVVYSLALDKTPHLKIIQVILAALAEKEIIKKDLEKLKKIKNKKEV